MLQESQDRICFSDPYPTSHQRCKSHYNLRSFGQDRRLLAVFLRMGPPPTGDLAAACVAKGGMMG
eukprot:5686930-Amphidinium_carterae.1